MDSGLNKTIQYNQVANYVVLNRAINIVIGKKAPNEYFKETYQACVSGSPSAYTTINNIDDFMANCAANCIPVSLKDMDASNYEDFLETRRKLMAMKIKQYFYSL